jgi:hypothetical protein
MRKGRATLTRLARARAKLWRPLTLYWRRRPARVWTTLLRQERVHSPVTLARHVHLHLTCTLIVWREAARIVFVRSADVRFQTPTTAALAPRPTPTAIRRRRTAWRAGASAVVPVAPKLRRAGDGTAEPRRLQLRGPEFTQLRALHRVISLTHARREPMRTDRMRARHDALAERTTPSHGLARTAEGSGAGRPLPPAIGAHLPEVLWRRRPAVPAESPPRPQSPPTGAALSNPPVVSPAVASERRQSVPASVGSPRTLSTLDPALAERLAEQVVRLVDRRARIERQRRGL